MIFVRINVTDGDGGVLDIFEISEEEIREEIKLAEGKERDPFFVLAAGQLEDLTRVIRRAWQEYQTGER